MVRRKDSVAGEEESELVEVNYSFATLSSSAANRRPCGKSLRFARCCVLGIILPLIFVFIPLHAKYISYHDYEIPLAASDVKILDKHVSTAWCQKQVLQVNASSYKAYLVDSKPQRQPDTHEVSMLRHFTISDDTKEYWGFYLLQGSKIKVTTCSGRYGATLLVIKGRHNLQYCAYVGEESTEEDDSSEEAVIAREQRKFSPKVELPTNLPPNNTDPATAISDKVNLVKRAVISEINSIYDSVTRDKPKANRKLWYPLDEDRPRRQKRRVLERTIDLPPTQDSSEEGMEPFIETSGEVEDPKQFAKKRQEERDGVAHDHGGLNFTSNIDSNSEEGSSFSSSEEALLKCSGFVEYIILNADSKCMEPTDPTSNEITITINSDDYYYFIFASDNEKYSTPISTRFTIKRVVYNISQPKAVCSNSTVCEFDLSFGSSEKVLLSLSAPDSNSSTIWDDVYTVRSVCEPRVSMYVGFVLTAIILLMFFAFA